MRILKSLSFAGMILIVSVAQTQAGMITITNSYTESYAHDNNAPGFVDFVINNNTAIPTNTTLSAVAGAASSSTTIGYNELGSQTILGFNMNHVRAGNEQSHVLTLEILDFTALANASYNLSGMYNLTGDGEVNFETILYDITAGDILFRNYQASYQSVDESLTLGQQDGESNWLEGSLTGLLTSGNEYNFYLIAYIDSFDGVSHRESAASAAGNVTLTISEAPTAVPEPTSLALLGLASLGGIGLRLRQRRKAKVDLSAE